MDLACTTRSRVSQHRRDLGGPTLEWMKDIESPNSWFVRNNPGKVPCTYRASRCFGPRSRNVCPTSYGQLTTLTALHSYGRGNNGFHRWPFSYVWSCWLRNCDETVDLAMLVIRDLSFKRNNLLVESHDTTAPCEGGTADLKTASLSRVADCQRRPG